MTLPTDPAMLAAIALFSLIALLSVLAFGLRKKLQARGLLAVQLLTLLVALVGLLALILPNSSGLGALGALALVGTFWLMSRFENTDRS